MREIPTRHGGGRQHGKVLSECDTGMLFRIEQLKERCFFSVIRTRGITWRGANSLVLFADQFLIAEVFTAVIAPEFFAHPLMHMLGEGFSQTISKCFNHDAVIVIARLLIALGQLLRTDTSGA